MESCPVCKSLLEPAFLKNDFQIGACVECDILAVMDSIPHSELHSIYTDGYYERDEARYIDVSPKMREIWMRRLHLIEKMKRSSTDGRQLLDVGCGTGVFLSVAQERGWEVAGIEVSAQGAALAQERLGIERIFSDLFTIEKSESFDVITIWDVIEHLIDPLGYLEKAHALLKSGGILALATVNSNALNKRFFGDSWRYFTPPEHLVYFNPHNLRRSLVQTGFRPIRLTTHFNGRAFWQSFPYPGLRRNFLPVRVIRKGLVTSLRLAANLFMAGDIIEVFAERS